MKNAFYLIVLTILFNSCKDNYTIQKEYYDNGAIRSITHYKNGERDGEDIEFYENGNKRVVQHFKNNMLNDSILFFYENGVLQTEGLMLDNKQDGKWIYYYPNRRIQMYQQFKRNKLFNLDAWDWYGNHIVKNGNGMMITYYDSLRIESKGMVRNNKEDGFYFWLGEDGDTTLIVRYDNGKILETKQFE